MSHRVLVASLVAATCLVGPRSTSAQEPAAQEPAADTTETRPFVKGGRGDRPYLFDLQGRLAIGGYAEGHFRYEREDGITEDLGFVAKRLNLFLNSQISDFVRFGAEIEFEDAAEEILLEYLTIDLLISQEVAFRAGMILVPLGRFNLAHDSPLNPFTDRPFVSTEILGTALSQPGAGALGLFALDGTSRITYEAYIVNGFDDGLLDAEDGVRIPEGKQNFENNNNRLSVVGRVAFSPNARYEFGLSGMHGQYNVSSLDGETIDEGRNVSLGVLDWDADFGPARLQGEAAVASVDIPPSLVGLAAEGQWGIYSDLIVPFGRGWIKTMASSQFEAKARIDYVNFDTDLDGDDAARFSLGLNFLPTSNTAFKLEYFTGSTHDRFNNQADQAGILFSAATYF